MTTPREWSFYVARPESAQLFRRFAAGRGVAPPPPTLRASTALRFGFAPVDFAAAFAAFPGLALPPVVFAFALPVACCACPVLADFDLLDFALAFTGAIFS